MARKKRGMCDNSTMLLGLTREEVEMARTDSKIRVSLIVLNYDAEMKIKASDIAALQNHYVIVPTSVKQWVSTSSFVPLLLSSDHLPF